jgi:peptide/nickel transport system substrate-binding protein
MSLKLMKVLSILVVLSLFLVACNGAAQSTEIPQNTNPPANTIAPESPTSAPAAAPTQPVVVEQPKTSRLGGWLDKIIFSAIPDAEPAVAQIQAGAIDLYSAAIDKADVYEKVLADPSLSSAKVYGSSNQILFNTVQCTDTNLLNPFTDMKIREAMNWAIDRNYVVQEIFGGLAKAKYTPFTTAFPDYARYADIFGAVETKYAYDLEKAKAVVNAQMPTLGATMGADGKWQYKGKPVVVIGLIRTEDKRKEIGNYFANQMELLGFTVDRQEKIRVEAAPIWQGDPLPCTFNYYTAGWISPQIYRDEGLNFDQYNTGKLTQITVMNAYQPSAVLLKMSDDLYTNNFKSMDERRELFSKAVPMSMEESWWGVWVNDSIAFEAFSNKVEGASDLAAGFGSQLFPFTIRKIGNEGGEVKIANSALLVDAWNPVAGSNWVDDNIVRGMTVDYGIVYNPYTGLIMPKLVQKSEVLAEEGLPIAEPQSDWTTLNFAKEIVVPDDAWVDWDATNQKFITAAEKHAADPAWTQTAKIKNTVVYIPELWKTTWHDGSSFTPADFVFGLIMHFDPGKAESKIYDEDMGSSLATFLNHFKGVRIVSTDPLTIETYDDQYQLDAENNAKDWFPNYYTLTSYAGGMMAWHNLAPAIQGEADGKMAFTKNKSTLKEVDYTSQISGPTLDVQMAYVDQYIADKYIPFAPTMGAYVTADEAVARYNNLKAFYAAHKHMVIGTGPYIIDQVFPVEGSITVVRNENYLFPADQFAGFSSPEMMTLAVEGPAAVFAGEVATFDVSLKFGDQPYPVKSVDSISYTLFNSNGESIYTGKVDFVADGQYSITLSTEVTAQLTEGTSKLSVAAASKTVSLPAFETVEFVVTK